MPALRPPVVYVSLIPYEDSQLHFLSPTHVFTGYYEAIVFASGIALRWIRNENSSYCPTSLIQWSMTNLFVRTGKFGTTSWFKVYSNYIRMCCCTLPAQINLSVGNVTGTNEINFVADVISWRFSSEFLCLQF